MIVAAAALVAVGIFLGLAAIAGAVRLAAERLAPALSELAVVGTKVVDKLDIQAGLADSFEKLSKNLVAVINAYLEMRGQLAALTQRAELVLGRIVALSDTMKACEIALTQETEQKH